MQNPTVSNIVFQERVFIVCAAIFISSLVACNLIFQKFFAWPVDFIFFEYTFEISVGILPYPVTFLVTDVVSEIYGKKRADQIVIGGLIASVFTMLIVLAADAVPQTDWSPISDETFNEVFGRTPIAVFASMVAYLAAQLIDIRLFHFWKKLTKGKHLWLRNNASTIASQFVDTFTVLLLLCMAGAIDWALFMPLAINGFLFKMLVALFDTPFFYLATYILRRKMGLQYGEEISELKALA